MGKGVESPAAAEALKAKVFSPGEPGVDVNRKGSLGDILVPSVMERIMTIASASDSGRDRRGGIGPDGTNATMGCRCANASGVGEDSRSGQFCPT